MKSLLQAALFFTFCQITAAAERATHFESALSRASFAGKDIVVFQRGSDWSRLGERIYANAWIKPEFARALPEDMVLVSVDQSEAAESASATKLQQITAKGSPLPPSDLTGIGATGYIHMHHRAPEPAFAFYGWGANQVKAGTNEWKLKVSEADGLNHPGDYRMRIVHAGGKDSLEVERFELIASERVVFGANLNAELAPQKSIETSLTVSSWNPAQKPSVRLVLNAADGKTDCSGRIEFIPILKGEMP